MTSEVITSKEDSKKIITNAVWGLLGALCSWLILYTINPNLVNLSLVSVPSLGLISNPNVLSQSDLTLLNAQNQVALGAISQATADRSQAAADQAQAATLQAQVDADPVCQVSGPTPQECLALFSQIAAAKQAAATANNNATIAEATGAMTNIYNSMTAGQTNGNDTGSNLYQQYSTALTAANANNDVTGEQTLINQYAVESASLAGQGAISYIQTASSQADFAAKKSQSIATLNTSANIAENTQYVAGGTYPAPDATTKAQIEASVAAQLKTIQSMTYTGN
jgi:hypothetical protein